MSTPDEIRADIERTRGELGSDVDALADKVSPSSIAHRQSEKVKGRFQDVRESVMGAAQSARSSASGSASGATGQAKDVAQKGVEKAKGNPPGRRPHRVRCRLASVVAPADHREGRRARR